MKSSIAFLLCATVLQLHVETALSYTAPYLKNFLQSRHARNGPVGIERRQAHTTCSSEEYYARLDALSCSEDYLLQRFKGNN